MVDSLAHGRSTQKVEWLHYFIALHGSTQACEPLGVRRHCAVAVVSDNCSNATVSRLPDCGY